MQAWRERLGDSVVLSGALAQQRYGRCTTGVERAIPAALRPARSLMSAIVAIAGDYSIPLYPISTGNNWGYGTAIPARDGCVVLDLSGLDRIVEMDAAIRSGHDRARCHPAKAQRLPRSQRLPFLVPVTGAGPHCSLLGNALERGYGITPYADHFAAVTALEAVLPDGRVYRSALSELGGKAADRAYKWGIGPYLDGLFAQSGFAIVTQMTIALAPRPERIQAFLFAVDRDSGLEAAVTAVQRVLRALGGVSGSINLMNARRVLAMTAPYPGDRVGAEGVLPAAVVAELAAQYRVAAWTGFGALYGNSGHRQGGAARDPKILRPAVKRLRFITPEAAAAIERWCDRIPGLRGGRLARRARTLAPRCSWSPEGRARCVAAGLLARRGAAAAGRALEPRGRRLRADLVLPAGPDAARAGQALCRDGRRHLRRHRIEPLITLTSLSDRCFDSSVPLLFDRHDADRDAGGAGLLSWPCSKPAKRRAFCPTGSAFRRWTGWCARPPVLGHGRGAEIRDRPARHHLSRPLRSLSRRFVPRRPHQDRRASRFLYPAAANIATGATARWRAANYDRARQCLISSAPMIDILPCCAPIPAERLDDAYRLRYQVYCIENQFEDRGRCPTGAKPTTTTTARCIPCWSIVAAAPRWGPRV